MMPTPSTRPWPTIAGACNQQPRPNPNRCRRAWPTNHWRTAHWRAAPAQGMSRPTPLRAQQATASIASPAGPKTVRRHADAAADPEQHLPQGISTAPARPPGRRILPAQAGVHGLRSGAGQPR